MPDSELIAYEKWMQGTSRVLRVRSRELKALDEALKNYDATRSGGTKVAANRMALRKAVVAAFDGWKASKGPGDAWRRTSRDGNQLFTLLDNQLRGLGDTDQALGVVDFLAEDMVRARLGALYLFSHLECEDSVFSVAIEGAFDLTTASLEYADVDPLEFTGLSDSKKEKAIDAAKSASSALAKEVEGKIRGMEGKPKKVPSAQLLKDVPPPMSERLKRIWVIIRDKVLEYAHKIIEMIRAKLNSIRDRVMTAVEHPGDAVIANLPMILRKLVDALTSRFLANAAPFIGAGLDIAKGVVNTLDAAVTKFREWITSREVVLASGHITVIVDSIKRAMWMSVGSGLYDSLKGGLKLGMEFASSGAAAIISLISSIIEAVVKTVWKMIEISRLKQFFEEAKELWAKRKEGNALQWQPIAFNQWFKGYSLTLPVLAVLALNTGITGNKMLFLQMFQSDGQVVSQSQFDAGVTYLDGLKGWGGSYLEDCGFEISSADKVVSGLLSMAKTQAAPLPIKGKVWQQRLAVGQDTGAWQGVKKFLNA